LPISNFIDTPTTTTTTAGQKPEAKKEEKKLTFAQQQQLAKSKPQAPKQTFTQVFNHNER
jgi:hypothetical protein